MTTIDTITPSASPVPLPTPATKWRETTRPEYLSHRAPWLPAAGKVALAGLWGVSIYTLVSQGHVAGLVSGVVILAAARAAEAKLAEKHTMFGNPRSIQWWTTPASMLVALPLMSVSLPAAIVLMAVVAIAAVAWDWSPWVGNQVRQAQADAGWAGALTTIPAYSDHDAVGQSNLTAATNPDRWEAYQYDLAEQLNQLPPSWECSCDRLDADMLAVGPSGVVGIYSVDFDGLEAHFLQSPVDEDFLMQAQAAIRERPGFPIKDSAAWERMMRDNNQNAVEDTNPVILNQATHLSGEFMDGTRRDFGQHVPVWPVRNMSYLATKVGMGADQAPVTVVVAHGVNMDKPWGRVHVRDEGGLYGGTVVLCHPRYVGECLASLPGVFASDKQIAGAQTAVDLRTR